MEAIEQRVIRVLADHCGRDPLQITRTTRLLSDLHFDSLDHVETLMELEDEFEITIPDETAQSIPADQLTAGHIIDWLSSDPGGNAGVPAKLPPRPPTPKAAHATPPAETPSANLPK